MSAPLTLQRGDLVIVSDGQRRLPGTVKLASGDHRVIAITFEGWVRALALRWTEAHGYQDFYGQRDFSLERSGVSHG
jgi:hypothetical protein